MSVSSRNPFTNKSRLVVTILDDDGTKLSTVKLKFGKTRPPINAICCHNPSEIPQLSARQMTNGMTWYFSSDCEKVLFTPLADPGCSVPALKWGCDNQRRVIVEVPWQKDEACKDAVSILERFFDGSSQHFDFRWPLSGLNSVERGKLGMAKIFRNILMVASALRNHDLASFSVSLKSFPNARCGLNGDFDMMLRVNARASNSSIADPQDASLNAHLDDFASLAGFLWAFYRALSGNTQGSSQMSSSALDDQFPPRKLKFKYVSATGSCLSEYENNALLEALRRIRDHWFWLQLDIRCVIVSKYGGVLQELAP